LFLAVARHTLKTLILPSRIHFSPVLPGVEVPTTKLAQELAQEKKTPSLARLSDGRYHPAVNLFPVLLALLLPLAAAASSVETYSANLSSLIDPEKLATLGKRGANPRIQKAVAILEDARRDGCDVSTVASNAVALAGYTNFIVVTLMRDSLTRNHGIAGKLGVFTRAGLDDMRRGRSPTIQSGPYRDDSLSVDHIVPVAVAPELDKARHGFNLEAMKAISGNSALNHSVRRQDARAK